MLKEVCAIAIASLLIGCNGGGGGSSWDSNATVGFVQSSTDLSRYLTPSNNFGVYNTKAFEVIDFTYIDTLSTLPILVIEADPWAINYVLVEDMTVSIDNGIMTITDGTVSYIGTKDIGITEILIDGIIDTTFTY